VIWKKRAKGVEPSTSGLEIRTPNPLKTGEKRYISRDFSSFSTICKPWYSAADNGRLERENCDSVGVTVKKSGYREDVKRSPL
jgi:hypothetical protein